MPGLGFAPMIIQKTKNMYERKNHPPIFKENKIRIPIQILGKRRSTKEDHILIPEPPSAPFSQWDIPSFVACSHP